MPADQQVDITTFSCDDGEWWTPTWLINLSTIVLGKIDLDPASSPSANVRVGAANIFTKEQNGLEQDWYGNVFLNPPSQRGDPTCRPHLWAKKLKLEYSEGRVKNAILIVKSVLGYVWYENLYRKHWVCHLRKRPHFLYPLGPYDRGAAKKGVSVFLLGSKWYEFFEQFSEHGRVIPPQKDLDSINIREL